MHINYGLTGPKWFIYTSRSGWAFHLGKLYIVIGQPAGLHHLEIAIHQAYRVFNHAGFSVGDSLCRCIGFWETDEDYYYKTIYPGGVVNYTSMVMGFDSVKRWSTYDRWDAMLTRNFAPKSTAFEVSLYHYAVNHDE